MADRKTFHPELYRDAAIPLWERSRIIKDHIEKSLITESSERSLLMGFSDLRFTWGRYNRSQEREFELLEWERQRQAVLIAGIASGLGIKEQDCFDLLPDKFPERLESYNRLGLDTPLLVPRFTRVSWASAVHAASETTFYPEAVTLDYDLDPSRVGEWQDPRGVKIPQQPFATWIKIPPVVQYDIYPDKDSLQRIRNPEIDEVAEAPAIARVILDPDARGATHWDGLALGSLRRESAPIRFTAMNLHDLIGSRIGEYGVLSLRKPLSDGGPSWLSRTHIDDDPEQRTPVICSREVTTRQ
jgi:hypothetical protein